MINTDQRCTVPPFRMDLDRARQYVAEAPAVPTSGLLLPSTGSANPALRGLLARRTLRRLLQAAARRVAQTENATDRLLYQLSTDALLGRPNDVLDALCTEPEITSWAAVAQAEPDPQAPRGEDPLAAQLAATLIPELAELDAEPVAVALKPDIDGTFTLRRAGLRLVPREPRSHLYLNVGGGTWGVATAGGPVTPRPGAEMPGFTVEALPRLLGIGPHLLPSPTAWVTTHVADELFAVSGAEASEFRTALTSGAEILRDHWPEAWTELTQSVRMLLPLPDRGAEPYNYSIHGFRGLILSSPRRSYLAAQTLAHETGHNKLSTLIDLFPLCTNPDHTVISPVVKAERPLSFVFHGCYAFSQDIALTRRLLGAVPDLPGLSMERYLIQTMDKVTAALEVLDRHADPEPVGRMVMEEVRALLEA